MFSNKSLALYVFFLIFSFPKAIIAETWMGNGSLISHHGERYGNINGYNWPFGVTQDVSKIHPNGDTGVVFFQWQLSQNCKNLRLDYTAGTSNKVNVTIGSWSKRDADLTFENVVLPIVVGKDNSNVREDITGSGWNVIAVSTIGPVSSSTTVSAVCTNDPVSTYYGTPKVGKIISLDGESGVTHRWNGNASVISNHFSDASNIAGVDGESWPFGATLDVTRVHPGAKPAVFFQWLSSPSCPSLTLSAPKLSASENRASLRYKGWNSSSYSTENITLPYTLNGSTDPKWTVLGLYFDNPVGQVSEVYAKCNDGLSSAPIFDLNPDDEKKDIYLEGNNSQGESGTSCIFNDIDKYHPYAKYATALCTTGILVGFDAIEFSPSLPGRRFGPDDAVDWAEITRVIELTNDQNGAMKECSGATAQCYINRAARRGFVHAGDAAGGFRDDVYKYITKVFWDREYSYGSDAEAFLLSKNAIKNPVDLNDPFAYLKRGELAQLALKSAQLKNRELAYGVVPIKKIDNSSPLLEDEEINALLAEIFEGIFSDDELAELFSAVDDGSIDSKVIDKDLPKTSVTFPPAVTASESNTVGEEIAKAAVKEVGKNVYPYVVNDKTRSQALTRMVYKQEAKFDTPAQEEAHYKSLGVLKTVTSSTIPAGAKVFFNKNTAGTKGEGAIGIADGKDSVVTVTSAAKGPDLIPQPAEVAPSEQETKGSTYVEQKDAEDKYSKSF